jgi:hypothetical protein
MSPEQQMAEVLETVEDVLSRWCPDTFKHETFSARAMRALLNLAAFEKDIKKVREGKTPIRTEYPISLEGEGAGKKARLALLSWFAAFMGGWNASPPNHPGRLSIHWAFDKENDIFHDDEKLAKYLLDEHARSAKKPLEEEIRNLKVKLYDVAQTIEQSKKDGNLGDTLREKLEKVLTKA